MMLMDELNLEQKEAVMHTEGPLLILAGAGSGKTRVITNRIARIIDRGICYPSNILAFTFTNKAANEMKERINKLVGETSNEMWIGTFHSVCVKILRRDIDKTGFKRNFVIFDTNDQTGLVKECMKDLNIDEKNLVPRSVLYEIGRAKDELIEPEIYKKMKEDDFRASKIADIYELYQKKLKLNNALDFDDIIIYTIKLFLTNPPVLDYYQDKFRYIHVDEYQDTNTAQYHLISLFAQKHKNLCVVGDDDQSIYSFRGANIRNILDFEKEFPDCKVIKLEQNYRSTGNILKAANFLIQNNISRKDKKLWTSMDKGCNILRYETDNEHDEAYMTVSEIKRLKNSSEGFKFSDFTILYRTNAQSRVFEDAFRREGIPCKILAGMSFYQRKEIKDVMSYLRLIHNPESNLDLKRIINVPKRGIGGTTVEKAEKIAENEGVSILNIIRNAENYHELKKALSNLNKFIAIIDMLFKLKDSVPVSELINRVIHVSGILEELEAQDDFESQNRIENIKELISAAMEYENRDAGNASLEEFVQGISLASETDNLENEDNVLMMTIHSAKGLEFPVVFLAGLEEGLFPGFRSVDNDTELEEERRLCYVGITRARKRLYLTGSRCRTIYGKTENKLPSRFIGEIPEELIENMGVKKSRTDGRLDSRIMQESSWGAGKGSRVINIDDIRNMKRTVNVSYKAGDRVMHKKFGEGVIKAVIDDENDKLLEINFESRGMRRLMASYANLEIIN